MTPFKACGIIEGYDGVPHTEEEFLAAVQYLIDIGLVWRLQGSYGRMAMDLIKQGLCHEAGRPGRVNA